VKSNTVTPGNSPHARLAIQPHGSIQGAVLVRQIETSDLVEKLARGEPVYLFDVREPWEHERAALPKSQLIPLNELRHRAEEIQVPEGTMIVVYCRHGIRSLSAAALLGQWGFSNVASLRGGIDAWSIQIDPRVPRY
jgi:adenylyltransferase/sulfurtransferase